VSLSGHLTGAAIVVAGFSAATIADRRAMGFT
jgi:hypothetical protein